MREAYQSSGVGAVNAVKRDRGLDLLGSGGIGAQAVDSRARDGDLGGGTEASAGETSGEHGDTDARDEASTVERGELREGGIGCGRRSLSTHKRGAKRRSYSDEVQLLPVLVT